MANVNNTTYDSNIAQVMSLGDKAESADKAYLKAIDSGNPGKIMKAQLANNKAQENLAAAAKAADQKHDFIMQLIQSLAA